MQNDIAGMHGSRLPAGAISDYHTLWVMGVTWPHGAPGISLPGTLIYITAVTYTRLILNLLFLLLTNINKNKWKRGQLIPYRKSGLGGNY